AARRQRKSAPRPPPQHSTTPRLSLRLPTPIASPPKTPPTILVRPPTLLRPQLRLLPIPLLLPLHRILVPVRPLRRKSISPGQRPPIPSLSPAINLIAARLLVARISLQPASSMCRLVAASPRLPTAAWRLRPPTAIASPPKTLPVTSASSPTPPQLPPRPPGP